MRKHNQKRYETHSYLKRVFAWENSTKNMRKRRYGYHDHSDSFWVRKLIQKHHLEGCRAESGFGPYQSWISVTCFGYSNSEVPRVYERYLAGLLGGAPGLGITQLYSRLCLSNRIVIARKSIRFSESCVIAEGWKPQDFSCGSAGFRRKNDTKGSRQRRGRR